MQLIRVLEMPPWTAIPNYGSGMPRVFMEVDSFPVEDKGRYSPKLLDGQRELAALLRTKIYWKPDRAYLILHPTHSFTINYTAP